MICLWLEMCFILLLEICFISTLENFFLVLGLWNYYMFWSFWFEYGETNFGQIVIFCCLKNVFIIYMDSAPWKLFGHYYMFWSFWLEYGQTNFGQIVIFSCWKYVFIICMDLAPWKTPWTQGLWRVHNSNLQFQPILTKF